MVRGYMKGRNPEFAAGAARIPKPSYKPPLPLRMITRAEWEALPPPEDNPGVRMFLPISHIRYTFTKTEPCNGEDECIPLLQEMQKLAQKEGLPDLKYNFLVDSGGLIYEGRGWDYKYVNSEDPLVPANDAVSVAYLGTYADGPVPWVMRHAGEHIRRWAIYHHLMNKFHFVIPTLHNAKKTDLEKLEMGELTKDSSDGEVEAEKEEATLNNETSENVVNKSERGEIDGNTAYETEESDDDVFDRNKILPYDMDKDLDEISQLLKKCETPDSELSNVNNNVNNKGESDDDDGNSDDEVSGDGEDDDDGGSTEDDDDANDFSDLDLSEIPSDFEKEKSDD